MDITAGYVKKHLQSEILGRKRPEGVRIMQISPSESETRSFRFSRYDPRLRAADGTWPDDLWTAITDVMKPGDAIPREYLDVEDRLVKAIEICLQVDQGVPVRACRIELSYVSEKDAREWGAFVDVSGVDFNRMNQSDVDAVARAVLRDQMWCEFSSESARCAVGHEMYARALLARHVNSSAVIESIEGLGLFVQSMEYYFE